MSEALPPARQRTAGESSNWIAPRSLEPRFVLAWWLSALPLLLDVLLPVQPPFADLSRFGLVLLPWLALAGMPGRVWVPTDFGALRSTSLLVGVALPPLGLSLGLDLANGRAGWGIEEGGLGMLLGLASLLALGASAVLGRSGVLAHRAQAWAWLVLVPGAAAVELALWWAPQGSSAGAGTPPPGVSPLAWCASWLAEGIGSSGVGGGGAALGGCALVWGFAAAGAHLDRREQGA